MLGYGIYWMNKEPSKYIPPDFEKEVQIDSKNLDIEKKEIKSLIQLETGDFYGIISLGIETKEDFQIDWGNGMIIPYYSSNFKQILPPMAYKSGNYTIKIKANCKSLSLTCNQPAIKFKYLKIQNCPELESIKFVNKIENVEVNECPKIKLWNLPN